MKRSDLEHLFASGNGLQMFAEQVQESLNDLGTSEHGAFERQSLRRVPDEMRLLPTTVEAEKSDNDFIVRSSSSLELSFFIDGLAQQIPTRSVRFLAEKVRDGSGPQYLLLLDSLVNRIASNGELPPDLEAVVTTAIQSLDEARPATV